MQRLTSLAAAALTASGATLRNDSWFDTLSVRCDATAVVAAGHAAGLDLRLLDAATVAFSFDETTTLATVHAVLALFGAAAGSDDVDGLPSDGLGGRRTDQFLTQSVFSRLHTETEMMRYLRRLADKDLALDRTMIPLGSCTMKLNAAAEMMPVTWPEFADVHPYAPLDETAGYREMSSKLE